MTVHQILGKENIVSRTKDETTNVTLQTVELGKQVLIFNNSKSRSEAVAERIADAIDKTESPIALKKLSESILNVLGSPTKQCKRLAKCVEKGVAFHHSGLTGKQRGFIEDAFKSGLIKVISSTPTLAAGLNLPAYKVIINDYKRYSQRGYHDIPILEFHQMSGRAGRPGKEQIGKAVLMVKTEEEIEKVVPKYIFGKPEEIISKLAVEPTLKMYLLSLISMDLINTKKEIEDFFSHTLYAHQYKDAEALNFNIFRIIDMLKDYGFVTQEDDYYLATPTGKRVSELYLNPDTANYFLKHIDTFIKLFSQEKTGKSELYSLIYFIVDTAEMRPPFTVAKAEIENYTSKAEQVGDSLVTPFNPFEMDYGEYLKLLKTSDVFSDWISEAPEDYLNDKYNVTPGELHFKLELADWLLYCLEEIALMKKSFFFRNYLNKLRVRFKAGIKEELLPLITLKGIGRVRARRLFKAGLTKLADLKKADFDSLSRIIGDSVAIKVKEQLRDVDDDKDSKFERRKPKEIKMREVSDEEIEAILTNVNEFEREKDPNNRNLDNYF